MGDLVFAVLLGIGPGAVFAMLAVGLVVAYRGSGVINFAHGAIAMYTALTFNRLRASARTGGDGSIFLPWVDVIPEWDWLKALGLSNLPVRIDVGTAPMSTPVALAISLAMAAFIGLLAHLLVFRPLRNASPLSRIIASVGIMIYLTALQTLHFGNTIRSDEGWGVFKPQQEPVENFLGLGSSFPRASLWLALGGVIIAIVVWAILRFTPFGLAARAVDENERAMVMLGYSADRIAGLTWMMSAVIAGLVGVIYVGFVQPSNMTLFIVPALGAALVGNLTSVPVAAAGGFAIAMTQSGGVWFAGRDWWPEVIPAAGVRQTVPLLLVIGLLFLRGDKLPIRGTLQSRGEPRAPVSPDPKRAMLITGGIWTFFLLFAGWKVESGITQTLVAAIFMMSLVVIVGFLGQISLAQWSIAGLAAFTMIRLSADGSMIRTVDSVAKTGPGWPDPLAALGGIAVAIVVGLIISIPAARVRGLQLAVISITAVIAVEELLLKNNVIMGAGANANNPAPQPEWFGVYVGAQKRIEGDTFGVGTPDNPAFTVLVLILSLGCGIAVAQMRRGMTGRRFLAIRSNERAAAAMGVNVVTTKVLGFGISAALAGLAGVLFTYKLPAISASSYGVFAGLGLLAFVYIAGITTVPGAFVGGILIAGGFLSSIGDREAGSGMTKYSALIGAFGMLAAALMANGEGVLRLKDRWGRWMTHWHDREAEQSAWGDSGRIPVLVLGGIALSDFVARTGLSISLEDLQDEFGFSDFQAGFIPFADVIAGALIVVGAGYLADRYSRTRMLTFLMVIWALLTMSTGLIQSFTHLFLIRMALGAMTSIDDPASSSLLSDFYPASIRHKAFSWRLMAPVVGGAFGNISVGIAIDQFGWRWGFALSSVPAIVLIWFVSRLPEPERGASDSAAARQQAERTSLDVSSWRRDIAAMRKVRSLPWLIAAASISFGPPIGVSFWAPTFLRRHHDLSASEAAGLWGTAALCGALLGGYVAARGPQRFAHVKQIKIKLATGGCFIGIAMLMLAYSPTPVSLKFPCLVLGAGGLIAAGPILGALISEVTPAHIRSSVFSLNSFFRLGLAAVAPLLIGYIADQVVFVDENVPVAVVADEAVEDRADRYECDERNKVILDDDDPDPDDRANRKLYECGTDEVGHLGAGMVTMLSFGGLAWICAWRSRRWLDGDIIANGGVPDDIDPGPPTLDATALLVDVETPATKVDISIG